MLHFDSLVAPLAHLARQRAGLTGDICAKAFEEELCPEESSRAEPAIILSNQLERLRNFVDGVLKDCLFRSVLGGVMRHAPTIAYTIEDATLTAGSVYAGGGRYRIRPFKESYPSPRSTKMGRATLCTGLTGDEFFGHFLSEDIPQMLLAPHFGQAIRLPSRPWLHLPLYRSLLEVEWREVASAHFEELTFFSDFAQNSLRRKRYKILRARLRKNLKAAHPGGRVYIRRRGGGAERAPSNEAEVEAILSMRGFRILDIAATAPMEFLAALLDASIVASVEGSNMMHAVYTIADDGGGMVLMPPMRPKITNKDRFDGLERPCAILVGDDLGDQWRVNLDELEMTLGRLEARLERDGVSAAVAAVSLSKASRQAP